MKTKKDTLSRRYRASSKASLRRQKENPMLRHINAGETTSAPGGRQAETAKPRPSAKGDGVHTRNTARKKEGAGTSPTHSAAQMPAAEKEKPSPMLSKNGREVLVGCLIKDSGGNVGRVTYVEGNVVVYRLADPELAASREPVGAEFRRSDVTVVEDPPSPGQRNLPDYHPHVATWDVGSLDDNITIYHMLPGANHFDKSRPVVATVAVNPDLRSDPRRVLEMMAAAPTLWRELRDVTAKYVWTSDALYTPETMEDFARITNLLAETAHFFPWDGLDAHGDHAIDARNTELSAAKAAGNREAVTREA